MERTHEFLGLGLNFPPSVDPVTGRFRMCSDEEDIKQSIYLILMTRKNERVMLPDFGSNLSDFVFELPDAASMTLLQNEVVSALIRWEPRIIEVDADIDMSELMNGRVSINVSYTVRATNNPGNLVFPYYLYEGSGG